MAKQLTITVRIVRMNAFTFFQNINLSVCLVKISVIFMLKYYRNFHVLKMIDSNFLFYSARKSAHHLSFLALSNLFIGSSRLKRNFGGRYCYGCNTQFTFLFAFVRFCVCTKCFTILSDFKNFIKQKVNEIKSNFKAAR